MTDMPHEKLPGPGIDAATGLVHLAWRRSGDKVRVSLCSSVVNAIRVVTCEQEYPTCLYCIDIVDRFW